VVIGMEVGLSMPRAVNGQTTRDRRFVLERPRMRSNIASSIMTEIAMEISV